MIYTLPQAALRRRAGLGSAHACPELAACPVPLGKGPAAPDADPGHPVPLPVAPQRTPTPAGAGHPLACPAVQTRRSTHGRGGPAAPVA